MRKIYDRVFKEKVLKDHYLDPKVISAIEKAVLDVKIFG